MCGQKGRDNLTVRKVYGPDDIRYLRCQSCGAEFSERKKTALWNTKVSEARAVSENVWKQCSLCYSPQFLAYDPMAEDMTTQCC